MYSCRRFLLVVLCLCAFTAAAQPRLVKDINVGTIAGDSSPRGIAIASLGNLTFFRANQADTGYELWKTDGTESGTKMVRDIFPGPTSGLVDGVVGQVVGNRVVFLARRDDSYASTLWATDGTYEGTVFLAEWPLSSDPPEFGPVIGSTLYFTALSATGKDLWQTDGTPAGTRALDLFPNAQSSAVRIVARLGSRLLLNGVADSSSSEFFTTDGTAEGTRRVGLNVSSTATGVSFGDVVLYAVRPPGATTLDLMRTEGTAEGTTLVRGGFTSMIGFYVAGGLVYFVGKDPANGFELWRSDGTPAGTTLAIDLTPGPADSSIAMHRPLGDRFLFATHGDAGKLWSTDGTPSGTRVVRDAKRVFSSAAVSGGFFYFTMEDATYGFELWKTDGTAEGTSLVADIHPGPGNSMGPRQGSPYVDSGYIVPRPDGSFLAASNGSAGMEPWVSDGTAAGTRMVKNIMPDENRGSVPLSLVDVGGRLFFHATSFLWTSDGTEEGTSRVDVVDLRPEGAVSSGGLYYFVNRKTGSELWRTDGTVAGTFRLSAIAPVPDPRLIPFKGGLFFFGSDEQHGNEPWFTDGTVAGTRLLKDVYPGTGDSGGSGSVVVDADTVLFSAYGGNNSELWLTDGATEGTRRLAVFESFTWAEWWGEPVKFGGAFFGLGARRNEPTALWRIDAASGQFTAMRRFDVQERAAGPWLLGGTMVFTVGDELWRSDGTEAGTVQVREDLPPACSKPVVAGDGVFYWYAGIQSSFVTELWRSDGTPSGTFGLGSGPDYSRCDSAPLHYSEGRLYFLGWDVVHGREPWVTDGTLLGTRRLWDVNPGPASSDPASFLRIGRTLFFSAQEPGAGRELWAMETGCDGGDCPPRRRRVRR